MRGIFGPGPIILGGGAALLVGFLGVGFLLPGRWEAHAEAVIPASSAQLRPYLESPEGWQAWTAWPDSLRRSGPERGVGARMVWDDEEVGSGSFRLESVEPGRRVTYAVEVTGEGGSAMRTEGAVELRPVPGGTSVAWREVGDLGSNPLMGYWAFFMGDAQATEMRKSLERLAAAVADSTSPGVPPDGGEEEEARGAADGAGATSSPSPTR